MGHPRKLRKKFSKPNHPWQKARIDEENEFVTEYGFKNKREIWKMSSILGNFKVLSKRLIASKGKQSEKESGEFLKRVISLGLLKNDARIEDVLGISLKDVFARRLQTIVMKKGLANSIKQARQFITHEHIAIGEKTITAPSYLVKIAEEEIIQFNSYSQLRDSEHPARKSGKEEPQTA